MTVRWQLARASEVPDGDEWLTAAERDVQAGLVIAKRRADWRLGRWAAKSLLGPELDARAEQIEVRAAADGAPDVFLDGSPVPVSLSLSHRDGVAVAAVIPLPMRVGVDLETLERRSDAFVREWLSVDEQASLPEPGDARDVAVLRCWTGKEASAKVLREGLRLDVRKATVVGGPLAAEWASLTVTWHSEGLVHHGWWRRIESGLVAVVADPPCGPPGGPLVTAR